MALKQITYSLVELCNQIEKTHGKIMTPFSLQYPTDPRCRWSLRIFVACDNWNMEWYEANDGKNVSELIGMDVVSFQWNQYDNDKILTAVVRD